MTAEVPSTTFALLRLLAKHLHRIGVDVALKDRSIVIANRGTQDVTDVAVSLDEMEGGEGINKVAPPQTLSASQAHELIKALEDEGGARWDLSVAPAALDPDVVTVTVSSASSVTARARVAEVVAGLTAPKDNASSFQLPPRSDPTASLQKPKRIRRILDAASDALSMGAFPARRQPRSHLEEAIETVTALVDANGLEEAIQASRGGAADIHLVNTARSQTPVTKMPNERVGRQKGGQHE